MIIVDLKKTVERNENFRNVVATGKFSQMVAMSIPEGTDIGEETHPDTDQIILVVDGEGEAIINKESHPIHEDDVIFVPAGSVHNIRNNGDESLKLLSIYAPAEHAEGTVHPTKSDATE